MGKILGTAKAPKAFIAYLSPKISAERFGSERPSGSEFQCPFVTDAEE